MIDPDLTELAQQIAYICLQHDIQLVGAVGRVSADGQMLHVAATQVTRDTQLASLLARELEPTINEAINRAEHEAEAAKPPPAIN